LTGYTDLNAAIAAVNEGNIFRFLTKPSTKEVLVDAINIGLDQYRSTKTEKGLLRKAQIVKGIALEREAPDICQWDNFEGPTGLGGPSQARAHLDSCSKINVQCYIVLLKLTALEILEQRYGEETVGDYLNVTAQYLVQSLRSEDRLFHWGRDVLMAVVRRVISADALRMEFTRIASARREHVINVNGRTIMIASSITFDLLPVSQRSTLDDMLAAFDANLSGRI
jgi:GGDEF domain-containing protein